ncbi:MAG: hypothetical protein GYA87_00235, partial [Christensenellaceae bacterium]|nr:hypothetical protein [Christensenellaceae bacterium]
MFKRKAKIEYVPKFEDINFDALNELLEHHNINNAIDNTSWDDLDMNRVFYKLKGTVTSSGDESLYTQLHNIDGMANSNQIWDYFQNNKDVVNYIVSKLKMANRLDFDFKYTIKNGFKMPFTDKFLSIIFGILPSLFVILAIIFKIDRFIMFALLSFFTNMYYYYRFEKKYRQLSSTIYYLNAMLFAGDKITKEKLLSHVNKAYDIEAKFSPFKNLLKRLGTINFLNKLDFFGDYLNIFFMIKPINNVIASGIIISDTDKLFDYLDIIGRIDMDIALSNFYYKNMDALCIPNITQKKQIEAEGIYHPLIKNAVANDIVFNTSLAITGSNMSGKSTFLRTIGINALLAQSVGFAFAKSLSMPKMNIVSSINIKDDVLEGTSYFMQESIAIKRMVQNVENNIPSLFLIDEIFKGTNPSERIAAASEICKVLDTDNSILIVATHDLNLLPLIPKYQKYYFTEDVSDDDIKFSYKIQKGVASKRNAIKILKYLKYPDYLID